MGGGIWSEYGVHMTASCVIRNLISGANPDGLAGGIYIKQGHCQLTHSRISHNRMFHGHGGGV